MRNATLAVVALVLCSLAAAPVDAAVTDPVARQSNETATPTPKETANNTTATEAPPTNASGEPTLASQVRITPVKLDEPTIRDAEVAQEERIKEALDEYDVPAPLESLAYVNPEKRQRMMEVLRVVRDRRVGTHADIATHCSVGGRSTVANYISEGLNGCIVKDEDTSGYEITPLGEKALAVPWNELDE